MPQCGSLVKLMPDAKITFTGSQEASTVKVVNITRGYVAFKVALESTKRTTYWACPSKDVLAEGESVAADATCGPGRRTARCGFRP